MSTSGSNGRFLRTGIWHTGLIVYGKEYFFGGGLQSMPHEVFVAMQGGMAPTEYIDLGATDLPQVGYECSVKLRIRMSTP